MKQPKLFDDSPSVFPSQRVETPPGFIPLASLAPTPARLPAGIARLAAEAEEVDARNDVEYRDLPCKTLVSPVESRRVPFDYAINPYRGCEFGCTYCLAPETPILYADMTWRPIGEVRPGDVVAGFDEYPTADGRRKFRLSVVEAIWWSRKPTRRLITQHAEVVATAQHRWLQARNFRWSRTEQLTAGRKLRQIGVTKTEEPDDDYRIGYIAGLSFGDGTMRYDPTWRSDRLGFPQSYWRVAMADTEALARLVEYLGHFGVEAHLRPFSAPTEARRAIAKVEVRSLPKLAIIERLLKKELPSTNYRRGFMAGFFDAEGHNGALLRISQRDTPLLARVEKYCDQLGFDFEHEAREVRAHTIRLTGPLRNRIRFFATCRPAISRKMLTLFGRQMRTDPEPVLAVEQGPVRDVVDIQTSTGTFYAAGLATHNCYARYTHEFMDLEHWLDFERKVFVKRGARAALARDLRRLDLRGKSITIGTATDPYQPAERRFRLTRSVLKVLTEQRGLDLSLTTKSDLVTRDIDLLVRVAAGNRLHVNITITTPHYQLARRIEPRAPRPDKRLAAVRALADAALCVGVFLMPILPGINDETVDLESLIRLAHDAGASYLVSQVLFLRSSSRKRFFPFVAEQFPDLLPRYRELYASANSEALAEYGRRKMAEIRSLKQRYGLEGFGRLASLPQPRPEQLTLGW